MQLLIIVAIGCTSSALSSTIYTVYDRKLSLFRISERKKYLDFKCWLYLIGKD